MTESRKSIFITGAASGLGREVGRYFASKGWFVGIADINEAGMAETASHAARRPKFGAPARRHEIASGGKRSLPILPKHRAGGWTCFSTMPGLALAALSTR